MSDQAVPAIEDPLLDILVEEVSLGIYQVLDYIRVHRELQANFNLGDLSRAANEGRIEQAHTWIFEFIKDGITGNLVEMSADRDALLERARAFSRPYLMRFCWCRSELPGDTCPVHETRQEHLRG